VGRVREPVRGRSHRVGQPEDPGGVHLGHGAGRQGDLVVSNWTVEGTHTGAPFYDVPASGEPVVINGTAILRMRDGQIVEHWGGPHCQEGLGLIR
jgi:hypothetical protein